MITPFPTLISAGLARYEMRQLHDPMGLRVRPGPFGIEEELDLFVFT